MLTSDRSRYTSSVFVEKIRFAIASRMRRAYLKHNKDRLRAENFSIISNNCWGGIFDSDFGRGYSSPFVNSYMFGNCYIDLIKSLPLYLSTSPSVDNMSKYYSSARTYPVLHLDNIEVHCIHYDNNERAIESWRRRVDRVIIDRILYVFSFRDGATHEHLLQFQDLCLPNSLAFVPHASVGAEMSLPFWRDNIEKEYVGPADLIAGPSYWKSRIVDFINAKFGDADVL